MSERDNLHFLMFPFAYGEEPVMRLVCLAARLRAEGHSVAFACADPAARVARSAGFHAYPVPEVPIEAWQSARAEGILQLHDEHTIHEHLRQEIEVIRQERPRVIIGDGRLTLPMSAHVTRVRYAQVTRAGHSAVRLQPPDIPASKRKVVAGVDVTGRLPEPLRRRLIRRLLHAWADPYNRNRRRLGMPPVEGILDVATGGLNLLADIPELVPTRDLPESFHWAGPLVPPPAADAEEPEWLASLDPERPIVVISLERLGSLDLLTEAIKRFVHSAFQAIFITGDLCRPEDILDVPPNLRFVSALPPGDHLWQAAQALVFDGYTPLLYRALQYGVPMAGIAATPDAAENLRQVEAAGAGVWLSEGLGRAVSAAERITTRMGFGDVAERMRVALEQEEYSTATAARRLVEFAGSE